MARRYYSSTAVATTLSGNINNSTTSITVAALSGYPAQTPFTAIIDPDTASEEVVEVTNVSGTTLTVTRGVDGTSAVSHNAGAVFRHGVSARDFDEANAFVNGGGIANSLITAKGQVVGASGSGVPVAIPAASGNGQVIVSDSTQASGNKFSSEIGSITVSANSDTAYPKIQIRDTSIASADEVQAALEFYAADPSSPAAASVRAQIDAFANSNGGASHLRFLTNGGTLTERMRIEGDGAVVIGNGGTSATPATGQIIGTRGSGSNIAGAELRLGGGAGTGSGAGGPVTIYTSAAGASGTALRSLTERLRVDSNGLITGTGSLGAWVSWTPTFSGWSLGSGTVTAQYMQMGKMVIINVFATLAANSTWAPSGQAATLSLPVTSVNRPIRGIGVASDASASIEYLISGNITAASEVAVNYQAVSGSLIRTLQLNADAPPFAIEANDLVRFQMIYEAA